MSELKKLITTAGETLPQTPWDIYPRPLLVRDSFFNLNGKWNLTATCKDETLYEGDIVVPFPPESVLSGVDKVFYKKTILKYQKTFSLPKDFNKGKVILHFGAIDQVAKVFINGKYLNEHVGGYAPFSFDVTPYLKEENVLQVETQDHLEDFILPYGKQTYNRGGMWYTPVSGIWQTVWLESVPSEYVERIEVRTKSNLVTIRIDGVLDASVRVATPDGETTYQTNDGIAEFSLENPSFWTSENPYLYYFTVKTNCDEVKSYFALRDLEIKEVDGIKRLCVNDKPVFFNGLLDQGYWPDGIFLPASPDLLTEEILKVKALGFNTLRKHIKVEPQIFYSECDRLGVYVWQDMVNNGDYNFFRDTVLPTVGFLNKKDKNLHKDRKTRQAFISAMIETVEILRNHPSVCYWTIFNEGWGQFDSQSCFNILKDLDDTRFIDTTSGWFRCGDSDVDSRHIYFRKLKINKGNKPVVISEFGGLTLAVEGHIFNPQKSYGYGKCKDKAEFVARLRKLYLEQVIPLIKKGLCGTIYTQVSDVEDEINGLFTYDRKVDKVTPEEFADIKTLIEKQLES